MVDNTREQLKDQLFDHFSLDKTYEPSNFELWLMAFCRKQDFIEKDLTEVCRKYSIKLRAVNGRIVIYTIKDDKESEFSALEEIG